jgi:branched-subunit amino acid transport protein
MCLANRKLSRRSRIFLAFGNLCMFAGLVLPRIVNNPNQHQANWTHFITGFLLGLALTFLFAAMYQARRNSNNS